MSTDHPLFGSFDGPATGPIASLVTSAVTIPEEPEESLIADRRGSRTPAQMVEQKLLALLRTSGPEFSPRTTTRPADGLDMDQRSPADVVPAI